MKSIAKKAAGSVFAAALVLSPALATAEGDMRSPTSMGEREDPSDALETHLDGAKECLDNKDSAGLVRHVRQASSVVKVEMARADAKEKAALETASRELDRLASEAQSGALPTEDRIEIAFDRASDAVEESESARS